MENSFEELSLNEKKFLNAILKRGNIRDTELCKELGISKATCSRIRKKLEEDLITEYIPVINLHKIGINVFLVLTFQWTLFNNELVTKKAFSEFENDPNVVFFASGEGSNSSTVLFIAFDNIDNYHDYLKEFRRKYGQYANNINTLLLPSKEVIKNDFTEAIRVKLESN